MLAATLEGDESVLAFLRMEYLPSDRTSWRELHRKQFFSPITKQSLRRPSLRYLQGEDACIESFPVTDHPISHHPFLHRCYHGLTVRQLQQCLLLLCFPESYHGQVEGGGDGSQRGGGRTPTVLSSWRGRRGSARKQKGSTTTTTTTDTASQHGRRRSEQAFSLASSGRVDSPIAAGSQSGSFRFSSPASSPRAGAASLSPRSRGGAADHRPRLDDVVPMDSSNTFLSGRRSDAGAFLVHLLLPAEYHVGFRKHGEPVPLEVLMGLLRQAKALCQWARWLLPRCAALHSAGRAPTASTATSTISEQQAMFRTIVTQLARPQNPNARRRRRAQEEPMPYPPLTFPSSHANKVARFFTSRALDPQTIASSRHLLRSFLRDTMELVFADEAIKLLQDSIRSPDVTLFLTTLDEWRVQDGQRWADLVERHCPSGSSLLLEMPVEELVALSGLQFEPAGLKVLLERELESLPRRTVGSVANAFWNASAPLGFGSALQQQKLLDKTQKGYAQPIPAPPPRGEFFDDVRVRYALPPDYFDTVPPLEEEEEERSAAIMLPRPPRSCTISVHERLHADQLGSAATWQTTTHNLEQVLVQRLWTAPSSSDVATTLFASAAAKGAVKQLQKEEWGRGGRSIRDLRPLSARGEYVQGGTDTVQRLSLSFTHRERRAERQAAAKAARNPSRFVNMKLEVEIPSASTLYVPAPPQQHNDADNEEVAAGSGEESVPVLPSHRRRVTVLAKSSAGELPEQLAHKGLAEWLQRFYS